MKIPKHPTLLRRMRDARVKELKARCPPLAASLGRQLGGGAHVTLKQRGKTRTVLGLSATGASTILFADKGGTARAGLGVDTRGVGTFTLLDRSGADLTGAGSDTQSDQQPADSPVPAPPPQPKKR